MPGNTAEPPDRGASAGAFDRPRARTGQATQGGGAGRRNWFDLGGAAYAQFRPQYPPALASWLASRAPDLQLALDVGCGNGQLTTQLALHFDDVVGTDPGAEQIAHALAHERVRYLCAPAEQLPLPDHGASLITAAQAAHWFDLPAFYAEARRVAKQGALLALISYGVLRLPAPLSERFSRFYRDAMGPFWPPERRRVDEGYAGLPFPFAELTAPALSIDVEWTLAQFLGYVATWSAVRQAREAGRGDLLDRFANDMTKAWGDPQSVQPIRFPLNMRVGVV